MYFVQGPFVAKRLIEIDDFCDDEIEVFLDLVVKALAPVGCGSASHAPARR
jgi:hypothetical protein